MFCIAENEDRGWTEEERYRSANGIVKKDAERSRRTAFGVVE
jgi:hypothetical protein